MTETDAKDGDSTERHPVERLKSCIRTNMYKLLLRFGVVFNKSDGMGTQLVGDRKSWTKMDKLLLAFGILVNFGDGVEIYLPGLYYHFSKIVGCLYVTTFSFQINSI